MTTTEHPATTTTTTTLDDAELLVRASAHSDYLGHNDYAVDYSRPQKVEYMSSNLATRAEAEQLLARFPKSYRLRVTSCGHAGGYMTYSVRGESYLVANGVNGGTNETGVKRYRSVVRKAQQLGMPVRMPASGVRNGYATLDQLDDALAGI